MRMVVEFSGFIIVDVDEDGLHDDEIHEEAVDAAWNLFGPIANNNGGEFYVDNIEEDVDE